MHAATERTWLLAILSATALAGCGGGGGSDPGRDGPVTSEAAVVHQVGNPASGRDVFRFETFGNEAYWTDAIRLPAGMLATNFTPLKALKMGLSVDSEAMDADTLAALAAELKTDLSPANAPLLNDVKTTLKLINANAVIGIVPKDTNGDGVLDVTKGDKTGASCALCHTITDASVFNMPGGGSIGKRMDGRAPHTLNFGALVAMGTNSRAFFPLLQLSLQANGGKTLGRAPTGLTKDSTEAEVDAYLSNPAFYPIGTFDDTFDGNGDSMHNAALFRTDLGAPWGTEGAIARLDNFSNLVYTGLLDPTGITTPGGRAFVRKLGGKAAGDEIVDSFIAVLAATGVTGYPFVKAAASPLAGTEDAPLGVRVDNQKLLDMNAYLNSLPAPKGVVANADSGARGRGLFRVNCTGCHNVDQGKPVPAFIVPMKTIFPGDNPMVLLPERDPPLNPILNTAESIFDDKAAVVNASIRGSIRGTALPLLLDLARKPNFLHDNSVPDLSTLLNPSRGPTAPHPFYFTDAGDRADVVEFLRELDTSR
ncbi:MAG: hypothetical protein M3Z31_16695 [Pseudomonadota bacterium]|nr:hypothetical protein [Pseudomonadota bacterium]